MPDKLSYVGAARGRCDLQCNGRMRCASHAKPGPHQLTSLALLLHTCGSIPHRQRLWAPSPMLLGATAKCSYNQRRLQHCPLPAPGCVAATPCMRLSAGDILSAAGGRCISGAAGAWWRAAPEPAAASKVWGGGGSSGPATWPSVVNPDTQPRTPSLHVGHGALANMSCRAPGQGRSCWCRRAPLRR